ncbi:hypothetical protein BD413DRAFT_50005 [Trametes elegans]|nr:hypothetical protein BD413DRAFT_50005 [Trametes elegans]
MLGLRPCIASSLLRSSRHSSMRLKSTRANVDDTGIPLRPTWSVNELLSSYPRPTITSTTLNRLHELSALIPPEEGSQEHARLTAELEELVRLVEAVKLVDVCEVAEDGERAVPDGRIWAEKKGVNLEEPSAGIQHADSEDGRVLLAHATRTMDGLYVVEADKPRN